MTEETTTTEEHHSSIDGKTLLRNSRALAHDAQEYVHHLREENPLKQAYEENPYVALGAAVGIGYVFGGGLFTPFSRRLIRMGMRALAIPLASAQIKSFAEGVKHFDPQTGD